MAAEGWSVLGTKSVALIPAETEVKGWVELGRRSVRIVPSETEVGQWVMLGSKTVTLTLPGEPPPPPPTTCSIDADCPEGYICKDGVCVKKGVDLTPLLFLGLGVLVLAASGKKEEKK